MNERAPRESARDKLLRNTAGFVVDKFVVPNDRDYVPIRGESRPLSLQEPYVLFVQPEQPDDKPYLYRLKTNANENALMSLYGESPYEPDSTREKSYKKVFQAGVAKGYELGKQAANDEIARLSQELSAAQQKIENLTAEVDSLKAELESQKQQIAELMARLAPAIGEPEPTADPEPTIPENTTAARPFAVEEAPAEPATDAEPTPTPPATPAPPAEAAAPATEVIAVTTPPAEADPNGPPADETAPEQVIVPEDDTVIQTETGPTVVNTDPPETSRRVQLRERISTRSRRGLGALAVAAVVGAVAWEFFGEALEHKLFGSSGAGRESRQQLQEIAQLKIAAAKEHLAAAKEHAENIRLKAVHAADVTRDNNLLTAIKANTQAIAADKAQDAASKAQILARVNEALNIGLRADHGILKQVHEINVLEHREALRGTHANTITAHSPIEFQKNVAQLLRGQGLHVSGDTPHRLARMSNWMRGQQIASGVNADHSQHLVKFSAAAFKNPSHQAGFKIGADGSGARALHGWINHAKSIGIKISA